MEKIYRAQHPLPAVQPAVFEMTTAALVPWWISRRKSQKPLMMHCKSEHLEHRAGK